MLIFLIILIAIIAVLMTIVVLLQSGKGGGLAGIASAGGGGASQLLGARHAPDILEKSTWSLATAFIVLCILTNFFIDRSGQQQSIIQQNATEAPIQAPAPPTPGTTTPPQDGGTPPSNDGGGSDDQPVNQ